MSLYDLAALMGLLLTSFILSTVIIRVFLPMLRSDRPEAGLPESKSGHIFDLRATGFWIGFCETYLIFILVLVNQMSALAIIIGAKQFVRKEKIDEDPSYYLLGTLANLCIAILFAGAARLYVI
ncbi:MAG: hypothetical protein Hens3KO_21480 [Henriciella sp.]